MVVYHVTTIKKLNRYLKSGKIQAPVRAWDNIKSAERFSKQTARRIIIRLKFPDSARRYEGHRGEAFILDTDFPFGKDF